MDIKAASLFNEMQMMAHKAGVSQPLEGMQAVNQVKGAEKADFSALLKEAVDNVNGLQSQASELRTRFDLGDKSVDLSDVMLAANKSSLAFDATVQVRNKVIDSYKQIMSMSI